MKQQKSKPHILYIAPTQSNFRLVCENNQLRETVDMLCKVAIFMGVCWAVAVLALIW